MKHTLNLPEYVKSVNNFCASVGCDPLMVQGAGGNVSWKDSDVMWIKASGKILSCAKDENIFVPVDLVSLQCALSKCDYDFKPEVLGNYTLRPSIETFLHALMKHKFVVHLHLVSALIHLINQEAKKIIGSLLGESLRWGYIEYRKPGPELAKALVDLLDQDDDLDVVFLENHGVVVGAETLEEVRRVLGVLDSLMGRALLDFEAEDSQKNQVDRPLLAPCEGYQWCEIYQLKKLATDSSLISIVSESWALFPDHVVFLGAYPVIIDHVSQLADLDEDSLKAPFIFVRGEGVLQNKSASSAHLEQIICYYNVLVNINKSDQLKCLTRKDIKALLNWDAEIYRQSLVQ
jgi:rhamnose utilization protein RhaD (predicted bifunctional aldolase and dehydrogenase)